MGTETYQQHEAQKEKHIADHIGDEARVARDREYRADHSEHEKIAHEKKACRRQQDETDAALAETADTILRGE